MIARRLADVEGWNGSFDDSIISNVTLKMAWQSFNLSLEPSFPTGTKTKPDNQLFDKETFVGQVIAIAS